MTAPNLDLPNTDPLTFVSIGQDPNKTPGWNIVTLSNGEVWKYASVVERDESGIVVQRIALTDNNTGEIGPDGPIVTPEIAVQLEAAGAVIPPIHATKIIPPTPPKMAPPETPVAEPPAVTTTAAVLEHQSLIQRARKEIDRLGGDAAAAIHRALDAIEAFGKKHL